MAEINKPEITNYFIARNANGSVLHTGFTEPHQVTTTGQPTLEPFTAENDFLGELGNYPGQFPALPEEGESLTAGELYSWNGQVVQVRQDHIRTFHDPDTVPALFLFYQAGAGTLDWIIGEQVYVGTRRIYEGEEYECLQSHVTQLDFTPTATINVLWLLVPGEEIPDWVLGTIYAIDVLVMHSGRIWKSLMNGNGFEPGVIGSWRDQSDPPLWVQPAGGVGLWQVDDVAEYQGQVWRCTSPNNAFAPGVFGWVLA